MSKEETAASIGAPATNSSRLEGVGGGNATGCRRGRASGGLRTKRRRRRWRGSSCDAAGSDGATGRRSGEAGEAAGGRPATREREGDGGEVARDHGRAREEAKTVERKEGVLFYRRGEETGHGGGRNGGENHGRRQWLVAGENAGVPGDWGRHSRGKLGGNERGINGDYFPPINLGIPCLNRADLEEEAS